VVPLSGEAIEPEKTEKSKANLFAELPDYSLESYEEDSLADVIKIQPLIAESTRATALYGSKTAGTFFNHLDVIRPTYHLEEVSVEICQGTVVALCCKYSNGLTLAQGRSRNSAKAIVLGPLGAREKILACTIETGRLAKTANSELCVTALLLYTNRGRSLLGHADDYQPARPDKTGVRGSRQFKDLSLVEFDPPLEGSSLRGFWGRSKKGRSFSDSDKIWRIGGIWSNHPTVSSLPPIASATNAYSLAQIVEPKLVEPIEEVDLVGGPKTQQDVIVEAGSVKVDNSMDIMDIDRTCSFIRTTEIPQIICGLASLGALRGEGLRARTDVLDASNTGMTIRSSGWNFKLFYMESSWMKLPNRPSYQFQSGIVKSEDGGPRNWMGKQIVNGSYVTENIRIKVIFPKEYATPPKVITWLTLVDIYDQEGVNHRVDVVVEGVTCQGCTIVITTWDKTMLVNAYAGWLAWDSEAPGIVSGELRRSVGEPLDHVIQMESGIFEHPPEVFVAFRHLDIRSSMNTAVRATILDRKPTSLKVRLGEFDTKGTTPELDDHTNSVADTLVVTYLAIE
jgi:hypothetical protein